MTKCKKHPKYKGIMKPRVDCLPCFKVYAEVLYEKWFSLTQNVAEGAEDYYDE